MCNKHLRCYHERGVCLSHKFLFLVAILAIFVFTSIEKKENRHTVVYIIDDFHCSNERHNKNAHGTKVLDLIIENLPEDEFELNCIDIALGEHDNVETLNCILENLILEDTVDLINMSFGMISYNENTYNLLKQLGEKGTIIIAAAGNEGIQGCLYPAGYELDCIISVGAAEISGEIADYSNYGENVDVFIETPRYPDNEFFSGTSAACAIFTNELLRNHALISRPGINNYILMNSETIRNGNYRYYFVPDWKNHK